MGEPGKIGLIDWLQLDRLCRECGEEITLIFQEFIQDAKADLAQFQQWTAPADCVAVGKLAHKLKGSSATFGLCEFSAQLRKIELAAQASGLPEAWELIALEQIFQESVALIRQERPALAKP